MPKTYYDSELTGAQIESALEAIHDVVTPSNNGKVLAISNGAIVAKSASEWGHGAVLEPLSVTANGDYTPPTGTDGFDEVHVAVPGATLTTKSITQNGTYNASSDNADGYSSVTVNVSGGGSAVVQSLSVTENGTYNPPSGVDGYAPVTVNVSGGASTDYGGFNSQIPIMTSDTTPSGTASASSVLGANFAAYRAFDGVNTVNSMQGGWLASNSDRTPWIQYVFDSLYTFGLLQIYTANNSTTTVRNVTVEGLKADDTWENCLKSGTTVPLTFRQNTYGNTCLLHKISLNGNQYKGIKITGDSPFYGGVNQYACTFDEIQIYSTIGTFPGVGYYGIGDPDPSFGSNGNLYTDLTSGVTYQKQNGGWVQI